jgi:hypothetical protein
MSGLEFVQGLVNGTLPLNTMAETLGYDIIEVSKGCVVVAAEPHAKHRNPFGTVHGLAQHFTVSEQAALRIVLDAAKRNGVCALCILDDGAARPRHGGDRIDGLML